MDIASPLKSERSKLQERFDALDSVGSRRLLKIKKWNLGSEAQLSKRIFQTEMLNSASEMAQGALEGDDARKAVRQALEKLPVGSPRTKMENARDSALAPFRAAKKAAAEADRYLQHVP